MTAIIDDAHLARRPAGSAAFGVGLGYLHVQRLFRDENICTLRAVEMNKEKRVEQMQLQASLRSPYFLLGVYGMKTHSEDAC
jgi:hypothetical protein